MNKLDVNEKVLKYCDQESLLKKTEYLELQRKAESHFQHTKSTFSSDTRQSMKRHIIAKHLTETKSNRTSESGYLGSIRCLAIIRRLIL